MEEECILVLEQVVWSFAAMYPAMLEPAVAYTASCPPKSSTKDLCVLVEECLVWPDPRTAFAATRPDLEAIYLYWLNDFVQSLVRIQVPKVGSDDSTDDILYIEEPCPMDSELPMDIVSVMKR